MEKLKNNPIGVGDSLPNHGENPFPYWPAELAPRSYQLKAVDWALNAKKSYLALDPGLGKTIVAALISNRLRGTKVYFISPPFLMANVEAEFKKWAFDSNVTVFSDTVLHKETTQRYFAFAFDEFKGPKILFIDEAHRFKNEKARRSKALFAIASRFERVVFLSGTPMPNSRPIELWPILRRFAPHVFGQSFMAYALKYCGAYKNEWGWKFDRFTNKQEFKFRITKNFMLRMKKADVEKELLPKSEGLLTVGENLSPVISKVEKKILAHYSESDLMHDKLASDNDKLALHIMEYIRLLGEYKLKYVLPYIEQLLEETKENILIFAHHKTVIKSLAEQLREFNPLVITGETPVGQRQKIVNEYQNNPKRRVFIGNIQACGVGFTLTKATRVLFVEFSWRDGDNIQAADRAHRIGQKNPVLVQYVVLKDSFDRKRMEVLLNKRKLSI